MDQIADFSDTEMWIIRNAARERYSNDTELMLADSELRLDTGSTELTPCPTVIWQDTKTTLDIFKSGEGRYCPRFYYKDHNNTGQGRLY